MDKVKGIHALAFDNGTTSRKWRFDGIASRFLQHTEEDELIVRSHKDWNGDTYGANLVILEMLTGPHIVEEAQKQGAKVIYEADDAVIDAYGKERKNLQHLGEEHRSRAIETIKAADAITVTNHYLAENYKRFTDKPIYILPNFVDFDWYGKEPLKVERNSDEIRIGWFGSRGHFEDLRWLVPVLKRILEKYPKVKFVYCGYGGMSSDRLVTEVGWGEDVFKELPRDRREFYLPAPPENWQMKHRMLDLDIGLAPLIDDYFNHCKTPIKWMEYSILRTPVVASPTVYAENPYSKDRGPVVRHGKTGFIAKTEDEWFNYLSQLIEDKALRVKMGKDAQQDVFTNWDLDKHWDKWKEVYDEVLGNAPEIE